MEKPTEETILTVQQTLLADKKVSRRALLKAGVAAAGAAGVAALAAACAAPTATPTLVPTATPTATPVPSPTPTPTPTPAPEAYTFFNQSQAATIKAIFAQLIPGNPQDPGAVEAGAHFYIDRALAGAYSSQQDYYRRGLSAVDAYSQSKYKNTFVNLSADQQVAVLTDMQNGAATGFYAPAAADFFATLLKHVKEGTFCDPTYRGNQNVVGWKMVGFPGAQVAYGDTDMAVGADQSKKKILTLADMESIPMPSPQNGF